MKIQRCFYVHNLQISHNAEKKVHSNEGVTQYYVKTLLSNSGIHSTGYIQAYQLYYRCFYIFFSTRWNKSASIQWSLNTFALFLT